MTMMKTRALSSREIVDLMRRPAHGMNYMLRPKRLEIWLMNTGDLKNNMKTKGFKE